MINTINPGSVPQSKESQSKDALERISREYGKPEEKQREAVKKLGKDEFFKIMVTQLQHQDPLKPAQNEQMAAQMAQFSSLEQMLNVNQNLEKLTQAQAPIQSLTAAGLIGKFVTADSSRIFHTEGKTNEIGFELPVDVSKVHINLINDRGESVREIEATNLTKGQNKVVWDGKRGNGLPASSGQYMMQISATTGRGKSIQVQTSKTQRVHGIGFEGKETILLVGSLESPTKLALKNISKIIDASDMQKSSAPEGTDDSSENNASSDEDIISKIDSANDGVMDAYNPQQSASKFSPFDLAGFRKAQETPTVVPDPSKDEIKQRLSEAPDLTEANPMAVAMKNGEPLPGSESINDNDGISAVNPEAVKMGYAPRVAERNTMPSSKDGSTSGQWVE